MIFQIIYVFYLNDDKEDHREQDWPANFLSSNEDITLVVVYLYGIIIPRQ